MRSRVLICTGHGVGRVRVCIDHGLCRVYTWMCSVYTCICIYHDACTYIKYQSRTELEDAMNMSRKLDTTKGRIKRMYTYTDRDRVYLYVHTHYIYRICVLYLIYVHAFWYTYMYDRYTYTIDICTYIITRVRISGTNRGRSCRMQWTPHHQGPHRPYVYVYISRSSVYIRTHALHLSYMNIHHNASRSRKLDMTKGRIDRIHTYTDRDRAFMYAHTHFMYIYHNACTYIRNVCVHIS